jgi:hypothetical protein
MKAPVAARANAKGNLDPTKLVEPDHSLPSADDVPKHLLRVAASASTPRRKGWDPEDPDKRADADLGATNVTYTVESAHHVA